jgi:hypothetical protein
VNLSSRLRQALSSIALYRFHICSDLCPTIFIGLPCLPLPFADSWRSSGGGRGIESLRCRHSGGLSYMTGSHVVPATNKALLMWEQESIGPGPVW